MQKISKAFIRFIIFFSVSELSKFVRFNNRLEMKEQSWIFKQTQSFREGESIIIYLFKILKWGERQVKICNQIKKETF